MTNYKILRSGQPAPYKDHELVVNVTLPNIKTKEAASVILQEMNIGFVPEGNGAWWDERLEYLVCLDKEQDLWEFKITTPYMG